MSDTEDAAAITPLDTLEDTIGSQVTVRTKAGQLIDGTLAGYDEHMNLTLTTATDDPETDDDHRLIRGSRVVAITHPPIEDETSDDDLSTDTESETDHDQTTRPTDTADSEPVPRLIELKDQLEPKNLTVDIDADGTALIIEKLGQEYRISPDGTIEGDGPHREQLEQFLAD